MKNLETMNSSSFRFKPLRGYLSEYFNKTHVNYIYNLSGNNISTTLYKIDLENSSASDGAGASLQRIGPESPYRFIEVVNVPIFGINQIEIPMAWDENSGYGTEIQLEAIVQPSIIPVEVDDYLVLEYSSYRNIWRVAATTQDTFEEIYYTRITLVPTQYTEENIAFQVRKRMSYIFESGTVIDRNTNNTINDILDQLNAYYKEFLAEFYQKQGIFIERNELNSLPSKFFNFNLLSDDVKVYNYFFKKYLGTSLITIFINHKEIINVYFNYKDDVDAFSNMETDEARFLYRFLKELEESKSNYIALNSAFLFMEDLRIKLMDENVDTAFKAFYNPNIPFFELDLEYYKLLIETFKLVEENDIMVDPNSKKTLKVFNNFKKLVKSITLEKSKEKQLKSFLLFYLFKSIPFKNINFMINELQYGN